MGAIENDHSCPLSSGACEQPALAAVLQRVWPVLPAGPVKVGVEAAGHYHRPLLGSGGVATGLGGYGAQSRSGR